MQLNEQISNEIQLLENDKTKLPSGILSRIRRTICEFNVLNANNRMYTKSLWEKVISNPVFKTKLSNRQILGEMEHPEGSQIKLDKDRTSHIVSNLFIDEASNSVKCDFDLLPTPAGQFINVLHEAGVKVTASLRADGELEARIDEKTGKKYNHVKEDAYKFITIDHTGDPSFSKTEPLEIIKATQSHYEAKDINKEVATALLEYVNTPESKKLLESVINDKQHSDCKCKLSEKKCSNGCSKYITKENILETIKTGIPVKINEKTGIVSHIFKNTKKAIVQFTDSRETVNLAECILLEAGIPTDEDLEKKSLELFKKSYRDLTFQEKQQVLDVQKNITTSTSSTTSDVSSNPIIPPVSEIPSIEPEIGFYKDGKGELLYVKEIQNGKVTVARQSGKDEILTVEEFIKLEAKKSNDKFKEQDSKELEKEKFKMEEAINKALANNSITEETLEDPYPPDLTTDTEFEGNLWKKSKEFLKSISPELVKTWTPEQQRIHQQVVKRKELGEKITTSSDTSGQPANAEEAEKDVKKSVAKSGVELDEKIIKYVSENIDSFIDEAETIKNLMETFKISEDVSKQYIKSIKDEIADIDKDTENIKKATQEIQDLDKEEEEKMKEAYIQEMILKYQEISQLKEQVKELSNKLAGSVKVQENLNLKLDEAKKKTSFLTEKVNTQKNTLKETLDLKVLQEKANQELKEEISRLEKGRITDAEILSEQINQKINEIESLKESLRKDSIKTYVSTKIDSMGLNLPQNTLALLENCNTKNEVDTMIKHVQEAIREGVVNSTSLSEVVVKSSAQKTPLQKNIDKKVEQALKGFGI